jgi:putative membrane protein
VTDRTGGADRDGEGQGAADGRDDGTEPDARYTFANERTFLAWSRTSLALVISGLAIAQLLPPFPGVPWGRHVIGTPLILLGCAVSVISYGEWKTNQRALRHGESLPRSRLPQILTIAIAVIGLAAAVIALLSGVRAP